MSTAMQRRLPRHIGFIPDGNRRWAVDRGMEKQEGYTFGIEPGLTLINICRKAGIEEVSIYGFTRDNTRRPAAQRESFSKACIEFASALVQTDVALKVVGDDRSRMFPVALKPYLQRQGTGIKVNLLINYGWEWDLDGLKTGTLRSHDVSRLDLIVRWGGGRRLSGFLPAQSVYADIFVIEAYWPDFDPAHIGQALEWFGRQDRTLGG